MDPGYRSPLIELFRRGEVPADLRLLAAQGALSPTAAEQLALLLILTDDEDPEIAATARQTIDVLPARALTAFLGGADVPADMKAFFAQRGIHPAADSSADAATGQPAATASLFVSDARDEEPAAVAEADPAILSGLPVKQKVKLAFKGTREQRSQLIRDPNRIVSAAVLSSPKLTEAEVESFARMANVSEDVLRVIAANRTWAKNYGVVAGLVRNPKTPVAISMQLLPRVNDRDMKMLTMDRNVPEALRLAARKFVIKAMK
jgi:hypothetical protein